MTPTATETSTQYGLATGEEITTVRGILQAAGHLGDGHLIAYLGLVDP